MQKAALGGRPIFFQCFKKWSMKISIIKHGIGYVLTINGKNIYLEGKPEAIEELKKLLGI